MENQPKRSIIDRILNPVPEDEIPVRVFFWVSILACLLLPRAFEALGSNKIWNAVTAVWLVLAVYLRVKVYFRR